MVIKKANFITSLASSKNLFNDKLPEIAFVGRSNVGKSSLINYLVNRKSLARTSSTPGRTRLINYFEINSEFYFVDLPGYGFAKGNKTEQIEWKKVMEGYLEHSKMLKLVCVLIDIRRDVSDLDMKMISYLYSYNVPFLVIVTKADKIAKTKQKGMANGIAKQIGIGIDNVFISSSEDKVGRDFILEKFEQFLSVGGIENV